MMDEKINAVVACVTMAAIMAITLVSLSSSHKDDQEQQHQLYCEMVGIYKEYKGEYGWPDYKGIAGEVCK